VVYFEAEKILLPSYRVCQDLITETLSNERERLTAILQNISTEHKELLNTIVSNHDGGNLLGILRHDQKDFRYFAIKAEVKKAAALTSLYLLTKALLPTLALADNTVRYYAQLVDHYPAARTRKLNSHLQQVYVLCFIHHRYQTIMDNLIMSFMLHMKRLIEDATAYAKQKEAEHIAGLTLEFPQLAKLLHWFCEDTISPATPYSEFCEAAFTILPKAKQLELADYIAGLRFDVEAAKWDYYEKSARRISMYLRPIMLHVEFAHCEDDNTILPLIAALKSHYGAGRTPAKLMQNISETLLTTLTEKTKQRLQNDPNSTTLHAARFEAYVYRQLFYALDNGRAYCNESVSFADLEDDLIDDSFVDKADEISEKLGYPGIADYCDGRLEALTTEVESCWTTTNQHIEDGQNESISIKKDEKDITTWSLTYPTQTDDDETVFFDSVQQSDIIDLLKLIGDILKIWPYFKPLKDYYAKNRMPEPMLLLGCILAEALGFGINVMSKMSNVSLSQLQTIDENFLYAENLRKVNDVVSNYIHRQSISRVWDLLDNQVIGDADGQKYETRHHTLQSRYSSKYFGTYKGISVYTLVANYIPINSKVIGPNEHESHHLYDILYNNSTDVVIDSVTGDGHSRNQCNNIVLDAINIAYIPSVGNIVKEVEKLVGTKPLDDYKGFLKPSSQSDIALIRSQKRGIIRILLSLMLQKTTQAVIVRKLSSHKRYSQLKEAFWAYNNLFHTRHMLNLVDNASLRQAIKTARNRTEAYHQLHKTIRKVYSGIFKGRRIVDNAISSQASRLVTNLVIAYNTMLLEKVYQRLIKRVGEAKANQIMAKISPVAWQHILFAGRYDLVNQRGVIDIEKLVDFLEKRVGETL